VNAKSSQSQKLTLNPNFRTSHCHEQTDSFHPFTLAIITPPPIFSRPKTPPRKKAISPSPNKHTPPGLIHKSKYEKKTVIKSSQPGHPYPTKDINPTSKRKATQPNQHKRTTISSRSLARSRHGTEKKSGCFHKTKQSPSTKWKLIATPCTTRYGK
jgi:hypothetical protein